MSKNIVVLTGSPRKNSSSARLAAAFTDGANAAGHSVTLFRVAGMKIGGCIGCEHCFEEQGVCVQKDDMQQILDALRRADSLVLASPVYFWGVTSQLKQAIDRMYALLKEGTKIKRAVLLMTCGDDTDQAAQSSIAMFRDICAYQKWQESGIIVAPGLDVADEIEGRAELEQARKLGSEI
ncbi:MAG: flavodoxin family protein [Leptospirales bacterium]|nr:flavodoxin family protein [Leptospirales bacterium]